jgi:hypothetical protein
LPASQRLAIGISPIAVSIFELFQPDSHHIGDDMQEKPVLSAGLCMALPIKSDTDSMQVSWSASPVFLWIEF